MPLSFRWYLAPLLISAVALLPGAIEAPGSGGSERVRADFESTLEALTELSIDRSRVARVNGLTLERDVGRFVLQEGEIILLEPLDGRTFGAIFVGEGVFEMTPPLPVERASLARYMEADALSERFRSAVFIFADGTATELEAALAFAPGDEPKDARREAEEAVKYLTNEADDVYEPDVLRAFLNGDENELFYAHFAESRGDPLMYFVNPYAAEEISLARKAENSRRKAREVVAQFDEAGDGTDQRTVGLEDKDPVALDQYRIDIEVSDGLEFEATASLEVTPVEAGIEWVPLYLHSGLEVESATLEGGAPVEYRRAEENQILWIRLEPTPGPRRIEMTYGGELLEWADLFGAAGRRLNIRGLVGSQSSIGWYPRLTGRQKASFELTFRVPSDMRVTTVGTQLGESIEGGQNVSRWSTPRIRNVGFNLGEFTEFPLLYPNIPPVFLQVADGFHRDLQLELPGLIPQQADLVREVGGDVAKAFGIFINNFGPSPVDRFYVTEIPYFHGEAFPGMVHLSWATFQQTDDKGGAEMFRGHEVAHQWWGIGVDFASYRDQWLSEGFSTFSGLWFMQTELALESPALADERYFEALEAWEDAVRDASEVGPIGLGYRAATSEEPENYDIVVYGKGAWVLHMLRQMTRDLETGDDSVFRSILQQFYQEHTGGTASTADFQRVVEERLGRDMGWFFDQWIYGSDIPKYRYAYRTEEAPGGGSVVNLRVRQEEVPPDFRMEVPVRVLMKDGSQVFTRVMVEGPETVVQLDPVSGEVDRVEFNWARSVLAEVDDEGW